jgi:urate oxidase
VLRKTNYSTAAKNFKFLKLQTNKISQIYKFLIKITTHYLQLFSRMQSAIEKSPTQFQPPRKTNIQNKTEKRKFGFLEPLQRIKVNFRA